MYVLTIYYYMHFSWYCFYLLNNVLDFYIKYDFLNEKCRLCKITFIYLLSMGCINTRSTGDVNYNIKNTQIISVHVENF